MPGRHRTRVLIALVVVATAVAVPGAALARRPPVSAGSTAQALVFNPNPVATTMDNTLRDDKDADSAVLNDQRVQVQLTNLDGSGYLSGDYAIVVSETGDPAFTTDGTYFLH